MRSFNDVTLGDNGGPDGLSAGYAAGPGYDLATGWGSPNVATLITNLQWRGNMNTKQWIVLFAIAVAGCSNGNNGNGNHDMAMGGGGDGGANDMTPPGDMTDVTPIPTPTATHVGATGATCCLVTDAVGKNAAYLLNVAPVTTTYMAQTVTIGLAGELHLVSSGGTDVKIASGVYQNGYTISPDGKALFYVAYDAATGFTNGTASLQYYPIGAAGATSKTAIATGLAQMQAANAYLPTSIGSNPEFSPSSNFFFQATFPPTVSTLPDLHIVDVHTGMDVLQRTAGGDAYSQLILPDDTLLFQDVVGGTGSPPSTPVQTLFWVKLGGAAAPAALTTHTAQFLPTIDNKTVVILKTSGDVLTWDATAKTGSGTKIASGAAAIAVGSSPTGPIAYTGADHSVHVVGTDGTKLLDLPAAANADLLGTPLLSQDNAHLYFWQNYETQNNRGTLMHAPVTAGASAAKVGDKISTVDLSVTDTALVFVQNVDDLGKFGDAATAALDGSSISPLGMKTNIGGLRVVNPGPATWFAMQLTGAAADAVAADVPVVGLPILGGLGFADSTGAAEVALDAKVAAAGYAFSDDGRDAVYVTGATWNMAANNYLGSLAFIATRAASTKIDGMVAGVSELGPITNRSLFVNAPGATTAGVYFVTY